MSEKKNPISRFFDKIRHGNQQTHSSHAEGGERLGYHKGNISQTEPKVSEVWDTCPVLDEQGKPIKED